MAEPMATATAKMKVGSRDDFGAKRPICATAETISEGALSGDEVEEIAPCFVVAAEFVCLGLEGA